MKAVSMRAALAKKSGTHVSQLRWPTFRQAERTEVTRRKLLAAAKQIFAKNGFEAARLEDISASAGYTC